MSKITETRLIIRKETIYDKIRRSFLTLIYQKDYTMIQRLEELMMVKRPKQSKKIIIPKEIRRDIAKI